MTWISARPVRPLPSANGWIVFELRVCDRRLNERGMFVAVDVGQEVSQQGLERLRWRRDERCRAGVVAAATDPVLHVANHTADVRHRGSFHQGPVDAKKIVECDRVPRRAQLDGGLHRGDVGEDFDSDPIGGVASLGEYDLGVEQPARACFQAFDLRGRDGLGALYSNRYSEEAKHMLLHVCRLP